MQRHYGLMLVVTLAVIAGSLTGCRDMGQMMGNRDAALQTGQWWAGPIPDATPIKPDQRTAWVSYKNVTQEQNYDLKSKLREGLVNQGYKVTEDPEQANFHVFYTLRFFGENPRRTVAKIHQQGWERFLVVPVRPMPAPWIQRR
jgi:hypothetical protein